MYGSVFVLISLCSLALIFGQQTGTPQAPLTPSESYLHNGLSQNIGNFSLELLNFTSRLISPQQNMVLSPITVWTILAVTAEGADLTTRNEIRYAARIPRNKTRTHREFQEIFRYLVVNTTTVELAKMNALFADVKSDLEKDFLDLVLRVYDTRIISVDFEAADQTAERINTFISQVTHGKIPVLVEKSNFQNSKAILTSAVYFKGQWTSPFNKSLTERMPFFDSDGKQIGEVNMMYNRYTYPFANIRSMQARILELPYGKENRLSMLVMLPYTNVSLEAMFLNFRKVHLDTVFNELKLSQENYSDDEVECYLPRFKIESNLLLNSVLKEMGVNYLFDEQKAQLPFMARTPMYVSSIIHKAHIEVTEEGTVATAVTAAEFANRIGSVVFAANRPFAYLIIEKITNSIVFGGFYQQPSLY
ncbi:Serine protease inhibitor 77Ba [Eumeta japonica]|uniref:Serine protease inhibitor 77Ba n=1 Tax=Eumeta variegata TaxID=151549 RepID=A0A4C1Z130_EUMVA|nr:Serine protease inhibitor 77Ba [Eumeta japonica]